jgi:hypothetical protein
VRAVDCPCGEHLEGRNDTDLLEQARTHAATDHPDDERYSEVRLRTLVNTAAYDAGRAD